jgi:hypothetical protein
MPNHEQIERRAYELYEVRGRVDGQDLDDWLQAERELQTIGTAPERSVAPHRALSRRRRHDRAGTVASL